jgi:hypothetical protein
LPHQSQRLVSGAVIDEEKLEIDGGKVPPPHRNQSTDRFPDGFLLVKNGHNHADLGGQVHALLKAAHQVERSFALGLCSVLVKG